MGALNGTAPGWCCVALLCLALTPAGAADEALGNAAWLELREEVQTRLETLRPTIDRYEGREEPPTEEETAELRAEHEWLAPRVQQLRQRKEEATEEQRAALEPARELYARLETLIQSTQEFSAPEESRDSPKVESTVAKLTFYGSIRLRVFRPADGDGTADDATSRIGARVQANVTKDYQLFGRAEFGTNILSESFDFIIGGDPGGDSEAALPLRLLFAGAEGPGGRISFGKQWAVYYDVAVFTDQAPFFGGEASGTYAAGTDGGLAGTGRADNALQYRFALEPFKIGAQIQIRDKTVNNRPVADTWGLSAIYKISEGVSFGAAFNKTGDGIPDPEDNQPKKNDESLIVGLRWESKNEKVYYGATYATFENHERDDLDRFFDGYGVEIYADQGLGKHWAISGTWNYQKPDDEHPGRYKIDYVSLGANYTLGEHWKFFAIYKFDDSRGSDGTPLSQDTLGVAVFYNFSRGFAPF
jgi:predicted porin